jgi:hypothetical protein
MQSTTTNPVRWTIADLAIFDGDLAPKTSEVFKTSEV